MDEFNRGISDKFIRALQKLSENDGWWRDVLSDNSLIIAVRNQYLNVYWHGQRIFKVNMKNDGAIVATIHLKYLLLDPAKSKQVPARSKQVPFDGQRFATGPIEGIPLIQSYVPGRTLDKLKTSADHFAGDEKRGVHEIVTYNDCVVDVEVAMQAGVVPDVGKTPRADIAAFEEAKQSVRLVLWEAKTIFNPDLQGTKPNVGNQIKKYRAVVASLETSIIKSYKRIAQNLIAIADMSRGHRKYNESVRKVADGMELSVDPADIGLIVFGFDETQRAIVLKSLSDNLRNELEPSRIIVSGETKELKIC